MDPLYTTEALATGAGRNGSVTVPDGGLEFDLASPRAMGGSGNGSNPEQLFAAGYAACFHSVLQLTAKHKVATPAQWQQGDDVIIAGSVNNEQAKEIFGEWEEPRPYIRIVPQPK